MARSRGKSSDDGRKCIYCCFTIIKNNIVLLACYCNMLIKTSTRLYAGSKLTHCRICAFSERFGVQIPARVEILIEISTPSAPPSPLSYDEYTVNGKMRRRGRELATRCHMPILA